MSEQPLLQEQKSSSGPLSTTSPGRLSVANVVRLKAMARKWKLKSKEHGMDQAMALGFRCGATARMATTHWKAEDLETKEPEPACDLQSNGEAVTNLLNNCLGSGVLAVAYAISEAGLLVGFILLAVSAILNRLTLLLVLDSCRVAGLDASYNLVAKEAFGAPGRLAVVCIFILMGFGCLVSYIDASMDAVSGLLKLVGVEGLSKLTLEALVCVVIVPPTYVRSMKSAALFSGIAFAGALVVVACVMISCGRDLMETGLPSADEIRWLPDSIGVLLAKLPTFALVFSIQAGGSIVVSTLKDGSEKNQEKVTCTAYILVFMVNLAVGVPSYLRFLSTTKGDVIENFDPTDPLTIIAKVAVLDLVILSYMFMMIPCRVALLDLIFQKNEAKQEASWGQFALITTVVNIAAVVVAFLVSDLAMVLGLVGAVAANSVAWILPASIFIKVRSNPHHKEVKMEPRKILSPANFGYFLLVGFGFFGMVSGVYTLLAPK